MPNVSSSWSLDDGHQVSVQLESDAGLSSSTKSDVMTPQFYGFELSDVVEETGVSPGGQGSFSFIITNTGNGDDTYTIELADNLPEGWQITPTTSTLLLPKAISSINHLPSSHQSHSLAVPSKQQLLLPAKME